MLGDFNADEKHMGDLLRLDGVQPIVRSTFTNTKQNNQEDNFILHAPRRLNSPAVGKSSTCSVNAT